MSKSNSNRDAAINLYMSQTQQAMKDWQQRVSAATAAAIKRNTQARDANLQSLENFKNGIKNADMYNKSFQQASNAAEGQAAAAGSQAQKAARQSGMSKAQAAESGANARQQNFNNALRGQQGQALNTMQSQANMAANTLGQQINTRQNAANNMSNIGMQGANNYGMAGRYGADSYNNTANLWSNASKQNYDQAWGNVNAATSFLNGMLPSDKGLKDIVSKDGAEASGGIGSKILESVKNGINGMTIPGEYGKEGSVTKVKEEEKDTKSAEEISKEADQAVKDNTMPSDMNLKNFCSKEDLGLDRSADIINRYRGM